MKKLNTCDDDKIDLISRNFTDDCIGNIKIIDVGPSWMTYEQLMERTAKIKSTEG